MANEQDASEESCKLCGKQHQHMSTPAQWRNKKAQELATTLNVTNDQHVCQPCRQDISKLLSLPSYIPRWEKTNHPKKCLVIGCVNKPPLITSKMLHTVAKTVLEGNKLKLMKPLPQSISLCKEHYNMVYKSAFPTQTNCITCGVSLKNSNPKTCPSPKLVEEHLKMSTGFEGSIRESDRVCYSCYRSHLIIIQTNRSVSNDSDLEHLIEGLQPPSRVNSLQEAMDATMLYITKAVAIELLSNSALLLPVVHQWFCSHLDALIASQEIKIDIDDVSQLVRARWILSNLTVNLQHHISYTCTTRKFGTLIYRSNSDLTIPLARALWKQRNTTPSIPDPQPSETEMAVDTNTLQDLNTCIHSQVQYWLSRDKPTDSNDINIDKWISETDPKLWDMICLLTTSISEKRRASRSSDTNSPTCQTKKIRRFFILCMILFCTDDRCSYPMHTLLTDAIDGQGGSALLIKVLNKMGVCSSSDTLSRFINYISNNLCLQSNKALTIESFAVVSADNLDYLHSFARVCKHNQKSSWHGTSVQLVQPRPSLSLANASPRKRKADDQNQENKAKRRQRTGTEGTELNSTTQSHTFNPCPSTPTQPQTKHNRLRIQDFIELNEEELDAMYEIQTNLNFYIAQRTALQNKEPNKILLNMQDYLTVTTATHTEKSNVTYLQVMDAVADNKDTLVQLLSDLQGQFITNGIHENIVLEGDAKLYEVLQSLKFEYGECFKWLIPFPGDWHMLMNYQHAIMKPYFDAGLKDLAKVAGYPIAAIKSCGQFKRTHHFLLEVWEAVYRSILCTYFSRNQSTSDRLQESIVENLQKLQQTSKSEFHHAYNAYLAEQIKTFPMEDFKQFIATMANSDDTWKFWIEFVFQDAMAYIMLFLAMRSGNWQLRMASIKLMVPLFSAFDHNTYQKVIAQHLADVLTMPPNILTMFQQGAFVVSIRGREWHSVGLDEAHEMLINKECKTTIVKPTPDYINRMAKYLPHRSKAFETFRQQLGLEEKHNYEAIVSPFSCAPQDRKFESNVREEVKCIATHSVLTIQANNRGLINPFCGKKATPEQSHDLLNKRHIGQREYLGRVGAVILRQPSFQAPNRQRRLQTFSDPKPNKSKINQLEKDRRLLLLALKRQMQHSNKTGEPVQKLGEQIIELPMALCDNQGIQHKGDKANTTRSLRLRYKDAPDTVFSSELQSNPKCTLIEGMFLINTNPLGCHIYLEEYTKFLLTRFILTQFSRGSTEVHVIFDNPERAKNTPKSLEQSRRDSTSTVSPDHTCEPLLSSTKIPPLSCWRENYINCRKCKRQLVKLIGDYLLKNAGQHLKENQTLYIAGCFDGQAIDTAWYTNGFGDIQPDPRFCCNAGETDNRLWLHATKTLHNQVLIISRDTDVYHIGLPLPCTQTKEIIMQISALSSRELQLLNITNLVQAFKTDPDLALIEQEKVPQIMQTIYAVSGCDYVSFFSGLGKATFLRYFFQYASFITAGSSYHSSTAGTLADTDLDSNYQLGYLAFLRLVGTIYFKKYSTGFDTRSPFSHFMRFSTEPREQQHIKWIESIRETIWVRTKSEREMVPSDDALMLHWKRSCWVIQMWSRANHAQQLFKPLAGNGWEMVDGEIQVVWDSEENIEEVRSRVKLLTTGCKCVTGCDTNRCGCRKSGKSCSAGCHCKNCLNVSVAAPTNTSYPDKQMSIAAISEQVSAEPRETEDTADWISQAAENEAPYNSGTDSEEEPN